MITVLQEPKAISFSKNPVVYKLNTNGRLLNSGNPCRVYLSNLNDLWLDESFTLKWGSQTIDFIVKDIPDDSGSVIRSAGLKPAAQVLAEWIEDLKANFYLDRDFEITGTLEAGIPRIQLLARKKDLAYQLSITTTSLIGFTSVDIATPDVIAPNFKIYAEVWVKEAATAIFKKVYSSFSEVDNQGNAQLDISEALDNALTFDRPNLKLPEFEVNTGSIRPYYIKIAEASGEVQRMRKMLSLPVKNVLKGGFSKELLEDKLFPESFIAGGLFKFLKQGPDMTVLVPDQPDFLTLVNLVAAHAETKIIVTVEFNDNSTQQITAHTFANVSLYQKITIPCGLKQLGLHLLSDTKSVMQYTIELQDGNNQPISELRTFAIDYESYLTPLYFSYKGSLGNYTSLFTHGLASYDSDYSADIAGKLQTGDFKLLEGDQIDFSAQLTDKMQISTGHLYTRRHLNLLKDFILSEDKHILRKGRAIPFSFTSKNFRWTKDLETLYALRFEIGFRFAENLFTDEEDDPDQDGSMPNIIGYLPPILQAPVPNFDDRYYLKTEVYNKAQVDTLLAAIRLTESTDHDTLLQLLADLNAALGQKAPLLHDHPDYISASEVNDLLVNLSIGNKFYGEWVIPNTEILDFQNPYDERIIVIYTANFYQALIPFPESEPGTDPLEWELIIGAQGLPGADSIVPGPPGADSTVPGPPGADSIVPGPPGADSTVPGPAGPGLPVGGTAGQIAIKIDSTDFNVQWATPAVYATKPIQIAAIVLLSTGWALVSGFYEYNYPNASITVKSIVDAIPDNASVEVVKTAGVMPLMTSSAGSVKFYAMLAPIANITVNITITESL